MTTESKTTETEKFVPRGKGRSRREVFGTVGTVLGAGAAGAAFSALDADAQGTPKPLHISDPPPVLIPRTDLVDILRYEPQARLVLGDAKAAPILGSDRSVTDRITLRPRVNISTRDLDLTCSLFGDDHFTPILVGPIAAQKRFHPEGELATAQGASAAKAGLVVSSDSSVPLATIAAATTSPLWLQVYAGSPKAKEVIAQAGSTKAKAIVVTVNAGTSGAVTQSGGAVDWKAVEAIAKEASLPVIVKGIARPDEAKEAVARGAKGVVVSNYKGGSAAALKGTLLLIAPVVHAVGDKVPVLADGSFRRGTDILKALGFGAKAVLIGRPAMWGLAAYGAEGVQGVMEMLQTELARYMAMTGRISLASIEPSLVHVHAPLPTVKVKL